VVRVFSTWRAIYQSGLPWKRRAQLRWRWHVRLQVEFQERETRAKFLNDQSYCRSVDYRRWRGNKRQCKPSLIRYVACGASLVSVDVVVRACRPSDLRDSAVTVGFDWGRRTGHLTYWHSYRFPPPWTRLRASSDALLRDWISAHSRHFVFMPSLHPPLPVLWFNCFVFFLSLHIILLSYVSSFTFSSRSPLHLLSFCGLITLS